MKQLAPGTAGKLIKGAFAGLRAKVVHDPGGASIDVEVSVFGKDVRATVLAHEFATELHPGGVRPAPPEPPPVEPCFDLAPPIDYDALFAPDGPHSAGGRVVRLPALVVPSGELVAFDPFKIDGFETDYAPFATRVEPGLYPVLVYEYGDLVRAAMVRFRSTPAAHWRVATPWLGDVERIARTFNADPSEPYAYECHATGAFADMVPLRAALEDTEGFRDRLEATMLGGDKPPHGQVDLGDAEGTHLVAFSASDGARGCCWWGEDEDGVPVALVTDLFDDDRTLPPDLRRPSRRAQD